MAKGILTFFLVVGLLILGAGLYLGHKGINKLESSYSEALGKQTTVTKKLQDDNKRLEEELKKTLADKALVEADLKKQNAQVESLLKQAQEEKVQASKEMESQIKAMSESLQKTVESCQIRPKPVKKAVVVKKTPPPAPKVEERIIIREVPSKPQTIVINKIFIQEGKKAPKLIKQERKVLPDAYPNDLLK